LTGDTVVVDAVTPVEDPPIVGTVVGGIVVACETFTAPFVVGGGTMMVVPSGIPVVASEAEPDRTVASAEVDGSAVPRSAVVRVASVVTLGSCPPHADPATNTAAAMTHTVRITPRGIF
jgi:hypothetical protein